MTTTSHEHRLYVGNLSEDATAAGLRRRFEECGNVADVELAVDRGSGRKRGFAFVTMADEASKKSALSQLNGAMFEDKPLRVVESTEDGQRNDDGNGNGNGGGRSKKEVARRAKVTSQYRERHNMTIEVDCGGVALLFRMYPTQETEGPDSWRVEASSKGAPERIVQATAKSRRDAFDEVQRTWGEEGLDWRAIDDALVGVRAI